MDWGEQNMSVLFLGNGINQLEGIAPSWNELLIAIAEKYHVRAPQSLLMTLGYDMFEGRILERHMGENENIVKQEILSLVSNAISKNGQNWFQTIHRKLSDLPIQTILTTNYDYAIELSSECLFKPKGTTKERLYSQKRYQVVNGHTVYHIHGELRTPSSICLGYEQYAGCLQKMRNHLCDSTGRKKGEFHLANILRGIDSPEKNIWYYSFFQNDIYILGFGLDASEMDIWWILSYRAKLKRQMPELIKNRVVYFDTDNLITDDEKRLNYQRTQLLEAFHVENVRCYGEDFWQRYEDALRRLRVELY